MKNKHPNGWVEMAPGFYIVEEFGSAHDSDAMRRQADESYREVRKAFEGKIEFVNAEGSE